MPTRLGAHASTLTAVRALLRLKGRREQSRFAFEGTTLLEEALRSNIPIDAVYATEAAYETSPSVREVETLGTAVFLVDERVAVKLSDVNRPSGIVCVTALRIEPLDVILRDPGLVLVLADLNDPANAGTLLRSAEAFGASGVVFGRLGIDPYHPKVVRGAMGAIFRLRLAVSEPVELQEAAARAGTQVYGLAADGAALEDAIFAPRSALVVGHERRGLGPWKDTCATELGIPMPGAAESLNAAVAGSIALYVARR